MSLDWYVGDIENFEELCYVETDEGRRLSQLTDGLIWATMHIGMPDITEKNWKEFYARIRLDYGDNKWPDAEDVKAHIGLSTNATSISRHKWLKELMEKAIKTAK